MQRFVFEGEPGRVVTDEEIEGRLFACFYDAIHTDFQDVRVQREMGRSRKIVEIVPHPVDRRIGLQCEGETADAQERVFSRAEIEEVGVKLNLLVILVAGSMGNFEVHAVRVAEFPLVIFGRWRRLAVTDLVAVR